MTIKGMVRFRSALNPELCLDVRGGSTQPGTPVQLWHVKGGNKPRASGDNWNLNQWWEFANDGNLVSEMDGNFVLDVQGSSPFISENHIQSGDAVRIDTQKSQLTIDQTWNPGKVGYLRSSLTTDTNPLVVDVPNSNAEPGTQVQLWTQNSSPTANQLWEIAGGYISSGLGKNLVLDVQGANAASGTPIIIYPKNNPQTPNQIWSDPRKSSGIVSSGLQESNVPLVLDVPGSSTNLGTLLQVWQKHGAGNQIWKFSSDYCYLSAGSSDLVLDVPGGVAEPETPLQIFERNYPITLNQLWIMDVYQNIPIIF